MAKKKAKGRSTRKRRGRGESMTEAQGTSVQVRGPVDTAELPLPAVEDYTHHKKNILGCLDSLESAKSRYRKALQSAQAVGIDTNALLEARRIVRENDPAKTAARLNQLAFALEQEGFSIHITVHDTLAGDQLDQIYRRFYKDGKEGKGLDNRYPAGSDLHAQAARAWRHGMAANLNPPLSPEQSDAAVAEEMSDIERSLPPPPEMAAQASASVH